MAILKFIRGVLSSVSNISLNPIQDGKLSYSSDTNELFMDSGTVRSQINANKAKSALLAESLSKPLDKSLGGTGTTDGTASDPTKLPLTGGTVTGTLIVNGTTNLDGGGFTYGAKSTGTLGFEIGSTVAATTPFIDFHSSGNNNDYDSRIIANGGSTAIGAGSLTFVSTGGATFTGAITAPPKNIAGGTNLNTLQTSGTYANSGTPANNYPQWESGTWFTLVVEIIGSTNGKQTYTDTSTNRVWVRTWTSTSTWSTWSLLNGAVELPAQTTAGVTWDSRLVPGTIYASAYSGTWANVTANTTPIYNIPAGLSVPSTSMNRQIPSALLNASGAQTRTSATVNNAVFATVTNNAGPATGSWIIIPVT